jgi:hypothetical protein
MTLSPFNFHVLGLSACRQAGLISLSLHILHKREFYTVTIF